MYARALKVSSMARGVEAVLRAPAWLTPDADVSAKLVRESGIVRLARLLADGKPHLTSECRTVAANGSNVRSLVKRLRDRGFDIISRRAPAHAPSYQLLATQKG
jgi:hypothetical protein